MNLEQIKKRASKDFSNLLRTYKNDERALKKNLDKTVEFLKSLDVEEEDEFNKYRNKFQAYIDCLLFEFELNKEWNERIQEANRKDLNDINIHGGTFH